MKKRSIALLTAILVLPFLSGCQTIQSTPATKYTYRLKRKIPMLNTWGTTVNASIGGTHKAVVRGFKDLDLQAITNQVDKIAGVVGTIFADGMDVEVKLEAVSSEATRISIRCGITGDQSRTELVFRAIEKHL